MLAGREAKRERLRVDHEVGRVRAVEELREPLVGVRVGHGIVGDEGTGAVVRAGLRCREFGLVRREREWVLVRERILSKDLEDRIFVPAVRRVLAYPADHAASRPGLVRARPIGGDS